MPIHLLQIAKKLAHDAGHMALKMQGSAKISTKDQAHNLVTEADKAVEELIVSNVLKYFPDHSILTEERDAIKGTGDYKWIIDPIDGTSNFAHGLPFFSVSIAVIHKGIPIIGVVDVPALRQQFWAQQGQGAYLGKKRIHVSQTAKLQNAMLATGFPYDRESQRYPMAFKAMAHLHSKARSMRPLGSAAAELAYVAAGYLDAYWEYNLQPWDIAAGKIILEEAGGSITNMDGSTLAPKKQSMLASNGLIHSEILQELKSLGADQL